MSAQTLSWAHLLLLVGAVLGLALLGVWAATLVWVYRAAEKLGKPGILVAALVGLVFWPVGGAGHSPLHGA